MKRIYLAAVFIISFMLLQGCDDEPALKEENLDEFNKITWIKGIWEGRQGDAQLYESWRSKSYRALEGISFTTIDKKRVYIQTMSIEQNNNKITMKIINGQGSEETLLSLAEVTDDRIVFTNDAGGFPEQVIYSKEGKNNMSVKLSGVQNADAGVQEFRYRKTGET